MNFFVSIKRQLVKLAAFLKASIQSAIGREKGIRNPTYWYEATDLQKLILAAGAKYKRDDLVFSILPMPYKKTFWGGLKWFWKKESTIEPDSAINDDIRRSFQAHTERGLTSKIAFIIHHREHWVLAVFTPATGQAKERIDLYDSADDVEKNWHQEAIQTIKKVRASFLGVEEAAIDSKVHCDGMQKDGFNCGPIVLAKIERIVFGKDENGLPATSTEIPTAKITSLRSSQFKMLQAYGERYTKEGDFTYVDDFSKCCTPDSEQAVDAARASRTKAEAAAEKAKGFAKEATGYEQVAEAAEAAKEAKRFAQEAAEDAGLAKTYGQVVEAVAVLAKKSAGFTVKKEEGGAAILAARAVEAIGAVVGQAGSLAAIAARAKGFAVKAGDAATRAKGFAVKAGDAAAKAQAPAVRPKTFAAAEAREENENAHQQSASGERSAFTGLIFDDFFKNFVGEEEREQFSKDLNRWIELQACSKSILLSSNLQTEMEGLRTKLLNQLSKRKGDEASTPSMFGDGSDIFYRWALTSGDCSGQSISMPPYLTGARRKSTHSTEIYQKLIQLLLDLGMDINKKDSFFSQTPLCSAIGFDNQPYALALLTFTQQIDLNATCCDTYLASTPLLLAIQRGNTTVAAKLIELGADINKADRFGMTPLHWAMIMGDRQTMSLLLGQENIQIRRANNGKYPIDYFEIDQADLKPVLSPIGTPIGNTTKAPEFRQILAHFWGDYEKFLEFRCKKDTQSCKFYLERANKTTSRAVHMPSVVPGPSFFNNKPAAFSEADCAVLSQPQPSSLSLHSFG